MNSNNSDSNNSDSDNNEYEIIKSITEKYNILYLQLFKKQSLSNIIIKLKQFKKQHDLCYNIIDFLKSEEYKNKFNNLSNHISITNDSALNNSALNDSALNNSASNDSALNDSASNDSASNNSASNDSASNNSTSNDSASNDSASNNSTSNYNMSIQFKTHSSQKRSLEERLKIESKLMQNEDINIIQKNKQQKLNNHTFSNNIPPIIQHRSNNNDINLPNIIKQSINQKVYNKKTNKSYLKSNIIQNTSTLNNDNHNLLTNIDGSNIKTETHNSTNENIFSTCFSNIFNCFQYVGKCITNSCSRMCSYIKRCFK